MYTNRGFFHRQSPSQTHGLQQYGRLSLPRFSHFPNYPKQPREAYDPSPHLNVPQITKSANNSPNIPSKGVNQLYQTSDYGYKTAVYQSPHGLKPPAINLHKLNSVFTIHSTYGYGDFRRMIGMGFLITPTIAITTHMVLPNPLHASKCYAYFLDQPDVPNRLDPNHLFFTNKELNFTLITFVRALQIEPKIPLSLHGFFKNNVHDPIIIYNKRVEVKEILIVEPEMICYTAGHSIPPGMPIFNYEWELIGLHHTSTSAYKINQGTRVDALQKFLLGIRHIIPNAELDMMLETEPYELKQVAKKTILDNTIYLYWFEWFTRNIYRFDTVRRIWNRLEPSNKYELQEHGNWFFLWNSRTAYNAQGNAVIIGGVSDTRGTVRNDCWLYRANDNTLHKLPGMLEARDSPAVVCIHNQVYVFGGRYGLSTCEKFDFGSYEWEEVCPMIQGRYSHSACAIENEKFIFVAGGLPIEQVGTTIERYNVQLNTWELLQIRIPEPLVNFGMFPITSKKLGILGGKYSKRVFVLEVQEMQIDNHMERRYLFPSYDHFRLHEVTGLTENIETIFPPVLDEGLEQVIIMTGEDGYAQLRVAEYSFKHFVTIFNPVRHNPYVYRGY